jgi:hypothetical protein
MTGPEAEPGSAAWISALPERGLRFSLIMFVGAQVK